MIHCHIYYNSITDQHKHQHPCPADRQDYAESSSRTAAACRKAGSASDEHDHHPARARSLQVAVQDTVHYSAKSAYTRNAVRAFDPSGQACLCTGCTGGLADARTKVVSTTVFEEVYTGPV